MYGKIKEYLEKEIEEIKENGLYKKERIITSPQGAEITISTGEKVLNFCANNYLGLSSHPEVVKAAKDTLDSHGFGMSSVRFICGTQDIHKELESKIAEFYGTEDTILYAAAFDANGGIFEPLLSKEDAIISDSLNHASIIDGVRLCKAARYRYENGNMEDLEKQLQDANANGARFKLIVTDTNSYVTGFTILGRSDIINENDGFWDNEYPQKKAGELLSDISLLDIDETSIRLSSLNGKFRFISFIFTRCPIPNMCPAVVIKNGVLANNFRNESKLALIMISFDYVHDTPEILKDFFGTTISTFENWNVWSSAGNVADLYTLSSEIGCEFWGIEENNIGHNLRSALIGPNMELLKVWEGDTWLAKDVRKDIESYMAIVK